MSHTFRVASFNIHGFIGRDGCYEPQRTLYQIKRMGAEVVALQEVRGDDRQGMALLEQLANDCGYQLVLGPTIIESRGHLYGNALLFQGEALEVKRHDISHHCREPRGAIEVRLLIAGEAWRFFATHLGLSPGERRWQVRRLLSHLEQDQVVNTVLMGDLNEWYLWGRPLRWLKRYFRLSHQPATFPSRFPLVALDRIWVHPYQRLRKVWVVKTKMSQVASDHLPLMGEISA